MKISIDREYLITTLSRLVQINSINPMLAPGGAASLSMWRSTGRPICHAPCVRPWTLSVLPRCKSSTCR